MHIVTLISDFGTRGYRLGSLKGKLLSIDPELKLVDITHEVAPFEIDEAAFITRSTYSSFPEGSIHLINVFNYYEKENRIVFFKKDGHYFVGPDNGVFSLIFEDLNETIYEMSHDRTKGQHYTDIYAEIVNGIKNGQELEEFGKRVADIKQKLILQPVTARNEIRGAVIFIDRFGNIIVNISKNVFEQVRADRGFSLYVNRHDHLRELSDHYMQADIGSPLCYFNSHGYLEIAVNLQRADELLGIKRGDVIQIKFEQE